MSNANADVKVRCTTAARGTILDRQLGNYLPNKAIMDRVSVTPQFVLKLTSMSEIQSARHSSQLPANLEDILVIAATGDGVARECFASHCSVEKYFGNPVVRSMAPDIVRREFDPASLAQYLPARDELKNVPLKSNSFLSHLAEGAALAREALAKDTPLRVRTVPEIPQLHELGIDSSGSVQAGLDRLNRSADGKADRKLSANDLTLALVVETQTFLEFEVALPRRMDSDSPLAVPARSAARSILHLCLAAGIARVGCNKLKLPDSVLKKILTDDIAAVQRDPWEVLNVELFKKCRELNSQPGVELLGALSDQHLHELLTAKNGLERAKKQIQKELATLEKREAQRRALQEKVATIGRQAKFESEAFQIAVGELGEAMRSSASRYARASSQEIERLCINLLEQIVTLPEAEMQFDTIISWSRQLKSGASVQQLKLPRVP